MTNDVVEQRSSARDKVEYRRTCMRAVATMMVAALLRLQASHAATRSGDDDSPAVVFCTAVTRDPVKNIGRKRVEIRDSQQAADYWLHFCHVMMIEFWSVM